MGLLPKIPLLYRLKRVIIPTIYNIGVSRHG